MVHPLALYLSGAVHDGVRTARPRGVSCPANSSRVPPMRILHVYLRDVGASEAMRYLLIQLLRPFLFRIHAIDLILDHNPR